MHPKENESNKMLAEGKHLETKQIRRYYTPESCCNIIKKEFRGNDTSLFKAPMAVVKEGITNNNIRSSLIDYDVFFNKAVYGFTSENIEKLKSIVLTFNSKLVKYFFFLTSSSWGIERDRIVLREFLSFPYIELNLDEIRSIKFQELNLEYNKSLFNDSNFPYEDWDSKILENYSLTKQDRTNINDLINYSIDLFQNQKNSKALLPSTSDQVTEFSKILTDKLNSFLEGQELYASATIYHIRRTNPLMMIKISFSSEASSITQSKDDLDQHLKLIDKNLWEKKATNIYFRKKLNYKSDNDIYIIRPNQRRFWSVSRAMEDASELILEILNEI